MAKRPITIRAKFLFQKKSAILLEVIDSAGNPHRISVPSESVTVESDDETIFASEEVLEAGIPYGIPFGDRLKDIHASAKELENALHRNGVWTAEDVLKNPEGVKGALFSMLSPSMSSIVKIARESMNKES